MQAKSTAFFHFSLLPRVCHKVLHYSIFVFATYPPLTLQAPSRPAAYQLMTDVNEPNDYVPPTVTVGGRNSWWQYNEGEEFFLGWTLAGNEIQLTFLTNMVSHGIAPLFIPIQTAEPVTISEPADLSQEAYVPPCEGHSSLLGCFSISHLAYLWRFALSPFCHCSPYSHARHHPNGAQGRSRGGPHFHQSGPGAGTLWAHWLFGGIEKGCWVIWWK